MRTIDLTGVGVALITPFHDNRSVDYEGLKKLVEHCISNGVDYLVVNGTTAENPTLTSEEKSLILQTVIAQAQDRVPIIYGIGGNNTQALMDEISNFDVAL